MMYETIDLVKDEDLDDSILFNKHDECKGSAFEDFQTIDGEIIDYGICEDEYEETIVSLKPPPKIPTQPTIRSSNSSKSNDRKLNCLCVKVVDCNVYPWYYKKYKKEILKQIYLKHETDVGKCIKSSVSESFNIDGNNTSTTIYAKSETNVDKDRSVRDNTLNMIPNMNRSLDDRGITPYASKMSQKKGKWKLQIQFEIDNGINRINLKEIDIKKNKGLVGMKIKRLAEEDRINEKGAKNNKRKKEECGRIEQSQQKTFRKSFKGETLDSLDLTITPNFDESQKTRKLETKSDPNKQNDLDGDIREQKKRLKNSDGKEVIRYKSMPKSKRIEMEKQKTIEAEKKQNIEEKTNKYGENSEIAADLKISTTTHPDNTSSKNKPKSVMLPTSISCETSSKTFQHLNKFTKKVLKIVENNPNMGSKTSVKDFKKNTIEDLTPKLRVNKQNKIKPVEASRSSSVDKVQRVDWDKSLKRNVCSGDILSGNKNKLIPPDQKKLNTSIDTQNGKIVDEINRCVSELAPSQNFETSKNVKSQASLVKPGSDKLITKPPTVGTTILINIEDNLREPLTDTSKQQQIAVFEETNPRRKQSVKVLPIENVGNIENIVNVNQIDRTTCQPKNFTSQESPLIQQNESSIQITSRNKQIGNSVGIGPMVKTSSVIINNHTPQKTQISAIVIRPTQTSNTFKKNMSSLAGSTQPYYLNSPVPSNAPRPLMSQHPNLAQAQSTQPRNHDLVSNASRPFLSQSLTNSYQALFLQPCSSTPDLRTSGSRPILSQSHPYTPQFMSTQPSSTDLRKNPRPLTPQGLSMQSYSNTFNLRTNAPRPLMSQPVSNPFQAPRCHVSLKNVRPRKRTQYQQLNNYNTLMHGSPQRMQLNTNFRQAGNSYMQNNCTQNNNVANKNMKNTYIQQSYQIPPIHANMPPGICNVHPNICWPYNYITNPPPPPPPPIQQQPQIIHNNSSDTDSSILGRNQTGIVKKISITTPLTSSNVRIKEENVTIEVENKETPYIAADKTMPVFSKSEMIMELATAIESPELTRQLNCELSTQQATALKKSKPGPLSKKLKRNSCKEKMPCKGYSLPILPIPTYENVLSEARASTLSKPFYVPNFTNNDCPKNNGNKKAGQANNYKKEKLKKISLKEYKKRAMVNK